MLAPHSDRYKADGADVAYRNINRAQAAAFYPADGIPLTTPFVGVGPSVPARPPQTKVPPPQVPPPGNTSPHAEMEQNLMSYREFQEKESRTCLTISLVCPIFRFNDTPWGLEGLSTQSPFPPAFPLLRLGIVSRRARSIVYLRMATAEKEAAERELNPKPDSTGSLVLPERASSGSSESLAGEGVLPPILPTLTACHLPLRRAESLQKPSRPP